MGTIGSCCCAPCEPCTEQSGLTTWSIYESILGMSFSGTLSTLNETACTKSSCVCERVDNVEISGEASITSDWTAYSPFHICGPCRDCETGEFPPPCATDINGNPTCDPSYPKEVIWDKSGRNGARVKFFYSAGIDFCLTVHYLPGNQIRFTVQMGFAIASLAESAYGNQWRYRRREFFCGYTTPISETVYNTGTLNIPEPLDPCFDPISEWVVGCDPYTPPTPPDPCETSDTVTVTETGCEVWQNDACVDVPDSATTTIATTVNCCDGNNAGCEPTWELQRGVLIYESAVFDCDSVPATIDLELDNPEATTEFTLEWDCLPGWSNTTSPIVFTIPTTLTLTVA